MSNVGDQIRLDGLLHALQGQDISNLTIIFGKCTECNHNHTIVYGTLTSRCDLGHRCSDRNPETFCCIDFDNNETKEARERDAK